MRRKKWHFEPTHKKITLLLITIILFLINTNVQHSCSLHELIPKYLHRRFELSKNNIKNKYEDKFSDTKSMITYFSSP